jgi:hypothetical protein
MLKETEDTSDILSIKAIQKSEHIIGNHSTGGLIDVDGKQVWLRHPDWRYNGSSWNWDNDGFTKGDISENGYHIPAPDFEVTRQTVQNRLEELQTGDMPADMSTGVEVEAALYDYHGNLIPKHDGRTITIEQDTHPELLHFTVESATGKVNGRHLVTPTEITQAVAQTVLEGYQIADVRNGLLTYTSVPEGGRVEQGAITAHPYLLLAAPRVLDYTLQNWSGTPSEAKALYQQLGIDPEEYLRSTGNLNWPVQALHIHSGVPQVEGMADSRIAHAMGQLRFTEMAKVLSFMQFNTKHLYGSDTGLKDVRSVLRRLLATTHNSAVPSHADALAYDTIASMKRGEVHSPSRYPASGQHDRVRFRMEAQYKTVESIDAPSHPDLRVVLTTVFANHILNVIALDALSHTQGDESQVMSYLQQRYGELFTVLPAMGRHSSYEQDLTFNRYGYTGRTNKGTRFDTLLRQAQQVIQTYGAEIPAVALQAELVSHMIEQQLQPVDRAVTLEEYLGVSSGGYNPNRLNTGIITDYKDERQIQDLVAVQSVGTQLQAQALSQVRDDNDIKAFFGL